MSNGTTGGTSPPKEGEDNKQAKEAKPDLKPGERSEARKEKPGKRTDAGQSPATNGSVGSAARNPLTCSPRFRVSIGLVM